MQPSEQDPSSERPAHFLQIWILPLERGLRPGYEEKRFPVEERRGRLGIVAPPDARDSSLTIHQSFLAPDASSCISGVELAVDGGLAQG